MLKKPSRKNVEDEPDVPDIKADDPVGTMERFATGLRVVIDAGRTSRQTPVSSPIATKNLRKKRLKPSNAV